MCVAGIRTYVFNVCLQRETRSSPEPKVFVSGPVQNAFVASDERVVCLQRDVVFGGCLIASDQHVRLECDIEFGGETSCILKGGLEPTPPPPPPPPQRTETRGKKFLKKLHFE